MYLIFILNLKIIRVDTYSNNSFLLYTHWFSLININLLDVWLHLVNDLISMHCLYHLWGLYILNEARFYFPTFFFKVCVKKILHKNFTMLWHIVLFIYVIKKVIGQL